MSDPDLRLHLRRAQGLTRSYDAEPVTIAIDMPGDGDPAQEAGDLAALLTEALPEETLGLLIATLLAEQARRMPWQDVIRAVVDATAPSERI